MPSKTAARSGSPFEQVKGRRTGRNAARHPRRKPAPRRNPSPISSAGATVGRGVRAGWLMLAKGAGSTARSVGRARDLEPGHRRDGIALALLGIAVVIAASSWFDAARPVGAVDRHVPAGAHRLRRSCCCRSRWPSIAVVLMRTEPDPETRPRLILGAAMIVLPALGLWHLWAGSPADPVARQHAAGFLGFAIGGPLSDGLTAWIAAPLLFIGVLFGLLLVTGTTIREVPDDRSDDVLRARVPRRRTTTTSTTTTRNPPSPRNPRTSPTATTTIPSATATTRPQALAARGTPMDNYPIEDEAPTIPEPTARARKKKPAKPQDRLDRVVEGPYTLPPLESARRGRPAEAAHRGQRPDVGIHYGGASAVQGGRGRDRLHPRTDRHPVRGRAGARRQGREDHCAAEEHRVRGRDRERPDAGADPRQVRRRHRGAQRRPRDGAAGRRAHRPVDTPRPPSAGDRPRQRH